MLAGQPTVVDLRDQRVIDCREPAHPRLHTGHQLEDLLVATTGQVQGGEFVQDAVKARERAVNRPQITCLEHTFDSIPGVVKQW
jgi:hypothetical protein